MESAPAEKKWIPIESNPQVFTQYAHEIGFPALFEFQDVYSLEPDMWEFIPRPILSLIFLYEIKDIHKEVIYRESDTEKQNQADLESENTFFIK